MKDYKYRIFEFLMDLFALSEKHGIYINGVDCWLEDVKTDKVYSNFKYGENGYEVDD